MSASSNQPGSRSWLRLQFSMGTLFWLMLVLGMALVWWKDRTAFERRLQKLEQMYAPGQELWGVAEILGVPDDPTGIAGKSWCPATSGGTDWVEVRFDRPVHAATIDLYESYSPGRVTEVIVIDPFGQTTIWQGTDPTPSAGRTGLFRVPVPKSIQSVQHVKVRVDSIQNGSWACLDAVALTTATGKSTWATSSSCSSVYGRGALSASRERDSWLRLW